MTYRTVVATSLALVALWPGTPAPATASAAAPAVTSTQPAPFVETWDGAPNSPQPWNPNDWDVTVHSRDAETLETLEPMQGGHGPDCAGPPATHTVSSYDSTVFLCRNHMMTSINASGYGAIYLTPPRLVDFSQPATIKVDVSTARTSGRDWWDLWITPYGLNVQAPLEQDYPDLAGPPKDAIHIVMTSFNGDTTFRAAVYKNHQPIDLPGEFGMTYESFFTPDAARRDTFQLDLSTNHLKFGMPADPTDSIPSSPITWVDTAMDQLGWSRGVVQLGHHSYNPTKGEDCEPNCAPNTWHWDNFSISRAIPFTIVRGTQRAVTGPGTRSMSLRAPAPAGAYLRFLGRGSNLEVSYDGGASWRAAQRQQQLTPADEVATTYWTPIPEGTTSVVFRGGDWFNFPWTARDVQVWADNGASLTSTPDISIDQLPQPAEYKPVVAARLLDTRPGASTIDGQALGTGATSPGSTTQLTVAGRGGIPGNAAAVILNITAANADGAGYLTVYPCGRPQPTASNLNYPAGGTVANTVISEVGANGQVCIYTGDGATHLLADVTGYMPTSSELVSVDPARLLDTRPGASTIDGQALGTGATSPGSTTQLTVTGRGGVPGNAGAVILNITGANAGAAGYLTVYPCGTPQPTASNLNYPAGGTVANTVISEVGASGQVCIYTGDGATHLLADVTGYLPTSSELVSVEPARLLDTRPGASTIDGQALGSGATSPGTITQLSVTGRPGIPSNAAAVVLNVTAANAEAAGYLTVYPCGTPRPTASNLNYAPGGTMANAVIGLIGVSGQICIYTGDGATHVVADVVAYLPAVSGGSAGLASTAVSLSAADESQFCEVPV